MREKFLIDTSVWIEYFKGKKTSIIKKINELLEGGNIVICGVILGELITGAKEPFSPKIINLKYICEVIEDDVDNWIYAGILRKEMSRKGENIPLIDCYIGSLAEKKSFLLWSYDKHFEIIKKYIDLKIYKEEG